MPLRVDNSHQRLATVLYSTVKSVHSVSPSCPVTVQQALRLTKRDSLLLNSY